MRFFLFLFLLSPFAWSCERPLTINYGPYVSLLVIETFFGEFHAELEKSTGCKVDYQLHRDFETYLISLFRKEKSMTLAPSAYYQILSDSGYIQVASEKQAKHKHLHIIARKNASIESIEDLVGRRVAVISSLSSSGSYFIEALKSRDLLSKVEIHFGGAYDTMILSVIKNEFDAAVIVQEYWKLLDQRIRDSQLKVIATLITSPFSDFYVDNAIKRYIPEIKQAIQKMPITWGEPSQQAAGSKLLQDLLQKKQQQFNKAFSK